MVKESRRSLLETEDFGREHSSRLARVRSILSNTNNNTDTYGYLPIWLIKSRAYCVTNRIS
jgi:hypothetical protein